MQDDLGCLADEMCGLMLFRHVLRQVSVRLVTRE